MLYQPVSQWHSLHFELLIELVAKKLTELWRFKNLAYFFTWWPSSMTYLFVNVTYWNCSPIPYVDQVWWWYVKAFMSYAWQNWQTNRQTDRQTDQTDRQTNRQTNILATNCKFWQVMKWPSGNCWLALWNEKGILWLHRREITIIKILFVDNLHMIIAYLMSNWNYIEYFESLLADKILNSMRTLRLKCYWKLSIICW